MAASTPSKVYLMQWATRIQHLYTNPPHHLAPRGLVASSNGRASHRRCECVGSILVGVPKFPQSSSIKKLWYLYKSATVYECVTSCRLYRLASPGNRECASLPVGINSIKSTVINGKVYCGGGVTTDDDYIVYCYDVSQAMAKWTTLPPLPVRWFGLGHVDGKLVAVGGRNNSDDSGATNEVRTYDERSRKWKQSHANC